MPPVSKTTAKTFFETGDTPTASNFSDLIDSYQDISSSLTSVSDAVSAAASGAFFVSDGSAGIQEVSADRFSFNNNQFMVAGSAAFTDRINCNMLEVSGGTTVTGGINVDSIEVSGNSQMGTASFTDITVSGRATVSAVTITSDLEVSGQFTGGNIAYNDISGTSYTVTAGDNGRTLVFTAATTVAATLPQQSTETLPRGFNIRVRQRGAGQVQFATQGSDVIAVSATRLNGAGAEAVIDLEQVTAANVWFMSGNTTET